MKITGPLLILLESGGDQDHAHVSIRGRQSSSLNEVHPALSSAQQRHLASGYRFHRAPLMPCGDIRLREAAVRIRKLAMDTRRVRCIFQC